MSLPGIKLEAVRRRSGGRIHLTPRVPSKGPVTTLCGQSLAAGTYADAETDADCTNCIRRSRDQSRVSSAFFAQDEGGELLRLSLERARWQRPQRPGAQGTVTRPALVPPPPKPKLVVVPDRLGELITRDFKPAGEGVWRSPDGVIVRMRQQGKQWRFVELAFDGDVVATRAGGGIRIKAGDVEVAPVGSAVEVRVRRS
ncbi:MAG: hypothetical protein ACHQ0J_04270 [Candidatus Dormibacterales bacterium]